MRAAAMGASGTDFDDKLIAALNYANGRRSVGQIARLVSGELGDFTTSQAAAWFELLAESGIVRLHEAAQEKVTSEEGVAL
jgi:hypothetical protein